MLTRFSRISFAMQLVLILLVSALGALVLAGCGGGSSKSTTTLGSQQVNLINGSNGLGGSTVNPAGDGTSGVKGTVIMIPSSTTSTTQVPIAGAVIHATLADGTIVGTATSDASGKYSIPLVPGTFILVAQNISTNIVPVAAAQQYNIGQHIYTVVNFSYYDRSK